jgi:type II secretory pathway pseudopilin PulG
MKAKRGQINDQRLAFSLIELVAVILVVGLMLTLTTVSLSNYVDQSNLIHFSRLIAAADQKERASSRKSPTPGRITINSGPSKTMNRKLVGKPDVCVTCLNAKRVIYPSNSVRIAEVIVDGVGKRESQLTVSRSGQSRTYAIRLESHGGASLWIVVIGVTGQTIYSDDSTYVRRLLNLAETV